MNNLAKYRITKRGKNVLIVLLVLILILIVFLISSMNNKIANVDEELGVTEDVFLKEEIKNEDVEKNEEQKEDSKLEEHNDVNTEENMDLKEVEDTEENLESSSEERVDNKVSDDKKSNENLEKLMEKRFIIYFDSDSYKIKKKYYSELEEIFNILTETNLNLVVEGNYNGIFEHERYMFTNLSYNRAKIVSDYLIEKGIKKERIKIINNEDKFPVNKDNTDYELSLNRRSEIYFEKVID